MSNHRPITDPGASVASIATGVALTLTALAGVTYILWDENLDGRALTGAALGFSLALLVMTQTVFRVSDRLAARERVERWEARQVEPDPELEPDPWLEPELTDRWAAGEDDPGPTVLNSAGWPVPTPETWRTDETQRLSYPGRQVHGPSAAALRPIQVPVFRDEGDRQAWADRNDLPTEVLPIYPEGWPGNS